MKHIFLMLLLIVSLTFGSRIAFAVVADRASQQTSADTAAAPSGHAQEPEHATSRDDRHKAQGTASVRQINQLHTSREKSTHGNPVRRTGSTAKEASVQNATNSTTVFRSPSLVRPTTPAVTARHHAPNPAVVNGSANSASGNTGAINGTRMNQSLRKRPQ